MSTAIGSTGDTGSTGKTGSIVSDLTFGLITVSAPYKGGQINEKTDTKKLEELEYPIVGILSNFGKKFDPKYEEEILKIIKKQKEKAKKKVAAGKKVKGRKPKERATRVPRSSDGTGEEFNSQVTIFVHDKGDENDPEGDIEKIYGVKFFRKESIQLPGACRKLERSRKIIQSVIDFVNKRLEKNICLINAKNTLTNMKGLIDIPPNHGFSLFKFSDLVKEEKKWKQHYTGDSPKMKVYNTYTSGGVTKYLQVTITQKGKINYIGINDPEFNRKIHREEYIPLIEKNRDKLIVRVYN